MSLGRGAGRSFIEESPAGPGDYTTSFSPGPVSNGQ